MDAQGGFAQHSLVAPSDSLDMQGVTARRQIGEASLLDGIRHTPPMVISLQEILILDIVLIRIVDALEMHDEGILAVRKAHLASLQHLKKLDVPVFLPGSLIESLALHLNT